MAESAQRVPSFIVRLLETLGLPVTAVTEQQVPAGACRVQAVMLEANDGNRLVLFGRDQLLDLEQLSAFAGCPLTPISAQQLQRMLQKHQLDCLPALPPLSRSACLYDQRLLQDSSVFVESGREGLLLELSTNAFKPLLARAQAGRFGVALADIPLNLQCPDHDRRQIGQALLWHTTRSIQQRLEATMEIPPLPQIAQKLMRLRVDPDTTVDDVTRLVEKDPQLAQQMVLWAAAFAGPKMPGARSVEDAIVRVLGFELGIHLALGLALADALKFADQAGQQAMPCWQQAVHAASVMEALALAIPGIQRPEIGLSYLCGLLNNIGYPLLEQVFAARFELLCRQFAVNPHLNHSLVEQHLLGICREQLGGWLLHYWDMPEELATAVRFQNDPDYAGPHALYANLLCLALNLLGHRGIGSPPACEVSPELLERLGIDLPTAERVITRVLHKQGALQAEEMRAWMKQAQGTTGHY